jgi:hypothetical protein
MELEPYLDQLIHFPLIDSTGVEVTGLGGTFTLQIAIGSNPFQAGIGAKTEIGLGIYSYLLDSLEAIPGPISLVITGVGVIQQNLFFRVKTLVVGGSDFTYTVTDSVTLNPIAGASVWITTDLAGTNGVWIGITDAFGVARDGNGNLPVLDPGTYYVWKQVAGYLDDDSPDTEIVT